VFSRAPDLVQAAAGEAGHAPRTSSSEPFALVMLQMSGEIRADAPSRWRLPGSLAAMRPLSAQEHSAG